ncbi:MAG: electron transfer flavoprotein beta subunit/FixA family protein [Bacteroidetes bacterium]|nr:MAG: electron transfer flavoprotein beta subunit/FixA family protein [Bacteroidota bacterium]RLD42477.1 MAG: electron transfer flavoprotein beta subunit/FixA family protein [Bacteroidota bacterium]RLD69053.1 MAG: electron transfer flavoprotein beta subunit/FixA family protein [Bacteroidota bacterium]RLD86805.1 MAG: electron transfer flavoprotein beta subunit/FixA family protein [Bacteroidota bacterium]
MKFLVLISNVPDTTTKIRFVDDNKTFDTTGVQWIINPWDELALTRAVELKEAGGIEKITVANVGESITEATLRKALAVGADDAIRIDAKPKDAFYVATQLAEVAKDYDVVMVGIEASDYNGSAVGGMLAEILGFNSVSAVSGMNIENGQLSLTREIDGGQQKIEVETPVVTIVQKGIAIDPRIPAMRGIMMARKKPLTVVPAVDAEEKTEYISFELPPPKAACKLVDEDNVKELVRLLQEEAKVL